jgi:hypothetical protein
MESIVQPIASGVRAGVQWREHLRPLRDDTPFHAFMLGYAIAVWLIGTAIGAQRKMLPLSFFLGAAQLLPLIVLLVVAATGLRSLKSADPLKAWRGHLIGCGPVLPGALLFASMCIFMAVFSSMKQMLTDIVPFFADPFLADLDSFIHGRDAWRLTAAAIPLPLMPLLEGLYLGCWGVALLVATLAALFAPKLRHVRAQYVWTFLIIWPLLGNIAAVGGMSAGPVFYQHVTGDARFADLIAYLAQHSHQAWVQNFLWSAYSGMQPGVAGAGISAFPSMHVASATLCALLARRTHRWIAWSAIVYCAIILFGSVHLGWHYAVDGYFSIIATILVWRLVGWTRSRSSPG